MKDKSIIHDILFFVFIVVCLAIMVVSQNNDSDNGTDRKIVGIHIKGEVAAPGYYELEYGSRIKDALILAGNETKEADLADINLALKLSDGEEIIIPSKQDSSTVDETKKQSGLINVNTADLYQLCKLDGIGEVIAANIINYRAANGPFKSVNDLKKVEGIGNAKFNKMKDKITV